MMILKYVGMEEDREGQPAKPPEPLAVGTSYEVAEIYEWPWHLMVRKPGERRWPAPDSPWFGWSADEFETPGEPVPILRCGFVHVERFTNFFGALVDNPLHIERFRALYFLRYPHYGETFDAWFAQPQAELSAAARYYAPDPPPLSPEVGRAYYDWTQFPAHSFGPPDTGIIDEVFAPDRPLKVPFLYVGRSHELQCCQACMGTRAAALKTCLERLLHSLGIDGVEAGPLKFRFWQRAEVAEQEVGEAAEEPSADDGLW
jgi:hypothetical protein